MMEDAGCVKVSKMILRIMHQMILASSSSCEDDLMCHALVCCMFTFRSFC